MAAAAQVFATTELLKSILVQVPVKTLLLSQRFDKKWQAVIKNSHKLQQVLFIKALPSNITKIGDLEVIPGA